MQLGLCCRIAAFSQFSNRSSKTVRNFYADLGVSSSAPGDTIRKAFLKLSKQLHPDKYSSKNNSVGDQIVKPLSIGGVADQKSTPYDQFNKINEAYKNLMDPQRRKSHDLTLGIREHLWEVGSVKVSPSFENEETYQREIKRGSTITQRVELRVELEKKFKEQLYVLKWPQMIKPWIGIALLFSATWLIWQIGEQLIGQGSRSIGKKKQIDGNKTILTVIPMIGQ